LEHVGIYEDWKQGYRTQAERDTWQAKDSLRVQRERLKNQGHTEEELDALERKLDESIRGSVQRASQSPVPGPDRLHHGVFYENA
jgi:TPP-dependent pyruvate/acetoin dehydrogenase alpha subunit